MKRRIIMNYVVIFAGGVGSRMSSKLGPIQYMEVEEKPILIYTLERFSTNELIDKIVVVVACDYVRYVEELVARFKVDKVVAIVVGGDCSHASIIEGIKAVKKDGASDDDMILFHDGIRPIINQFTICNCIKGAEENGNSITCIPAIETFAQSLDRACVDSVTIREDMFSLQAPQAYHFKDAYELNQRAIQEGIVGTVADQAELNCYYGKTLYLCEGLHGNIKIKYPIDFTYFEFLVKSGKYQKIVNDMPF